MSVRARLRRLFSRKTIGKDAVAGLVLGVEAVPDGLAAGLLAGINPLAGLYAYLFGMVGATFFTSSTFMAVQATGAMALIVSDSDLHTRADPDRALYTLAILTGIVMIVAGLLKGGRLIRFVPTAVMTGFVTAVGVNIILGQLSNLTGYASHGANRLVKTFDLLAHMPRWSWASVSIGLLVIALILLFRRTPVGSLGLVVAVVLGSALAVLLNQWVEPSIVLLRDVVDVPRGLPAPVLPNIEDVAFLLVPAISLAFVGVIQGSAVSAGLPTADGKPADGSRDFLGQGAGNIAAGIFQGMPVGGSMSGSSLIVAAGAKTRLLVHRGGGGHGARDPARRRPRLLRRHAGARRPADRGGRGRDQAEPHLLRRQERAPPHLDHGRHVRAHPRDPAAVRRAGRRRARHHPVRRPAVKSRAGAAGAHPRRREDQGVRSPRPHPGRFRGGAAAVREPLLRERPRVRAAAPRGEPGVVSTRSW